MSDLFSLGQMKNGVKNDGLCVLTGEMIYQHGINREIQNIDTIIMFTKRLQSKKEGLD